jgi:hypothetical protein
MKTYRNIAVARSLGLLAVASLVLLVPMGWWTLALAFVFAGGASLLSPHHRRGGRRRLRALANRIEQRLTRHTWRPGHR